ncbi:MAG: TIGR02147 family protein [Fibrobacteria bacterium]|nr:TIGR02147 family protein [Fibrobacteria bacterium]
MNRPDIHDFTSHREYLRTILAWGRARRDPRFLQRNILDRLGVASTGFLSNVLAGRKNLSPTQIRRFAEILELSAGDAEYFETLVHCGQARGETEQREWLERLGRLRTISISTLSEETIGLFARMESVFLYEYLTFATFDGNAEELGACFDPPYRGEEILSALAHLRRLGLVEQDARGRWIARSQAVSSGPDADSPELASFHRRAMALARRSLAKVPSGERDLSVLSLGLSEDGYRRARAEIAHLRRRLVGIAMEETHPERIYQLNFHLIPVSSRLDEHSS